MITQKEKDQQTEKWTGGENELEIVEVLVDSKEEPQGKE